MILTEKSILKIDIFSARLGLFSLSRHKNNIFHFPSTPSTRLSTSRPHLLVTFKKTQKKKTQQQHYSNKKALDVGLNHVDITCLFDVFELKHYSALYD